MCFFRRGHEVYVVMPFDEKSAKASNVTVINIDPESKLEKFLGSISNDQLKVGAAGVAPIFDLMNIGVEMTGNALNHPTMQEFLKDPVKNKFDVWVVSPFLATEAGYYLAHKLNASLILVNFCTLYSFFLPSSGLL